VFGLTGGEMLGDFGKRRGHEESIAAESLAALRRISSASADQRCSRSRNNRCVGRIVCIAVMREKKAATVCAPRMVAKDLSQISRLMSGGGVAGIAKELPSMRTARRIAHEGDAFGLIEITDVSDAWPVYRRLRVCASRA